MHNYIGLIFSLADKGYGNSIHSYFHKRGYDSKVIELQVDFADFLLQKSITLIEEANTLIFLLSKEFLKDRACVQALLYAAKHNLKYFAIYLEEFQMPGDIALQLGSYQAVMLKNFHSHLEMAEEIIHSNILEQCRSLSIKKDEPISKEDKEHQSLVYSFQKTLLTNICLILLYGAFYYWFFKYPNTAYESELVVYCIPILFLVLYALMLCFLKNIHYKVLFYLNLFFLGITILMPLSGLSILNPKIIAYAEMTYVITSIFGSKNLFTKKGTIKYWEIFGLVLILGKTLFGFLISEVKDIYLSKVVIVFTLIHTILMIVALIMNYKCHKRGESHS